MERPTFKRYGSDDEGHYFVPVETPAASSGSGTNYFRLFLVGAGLLAVTAMLRACGEAQVGTATAVSHLPKVSIWETVLIYVVAIVSGVAAIAFVLVQSVVAYRERSNYWMLRMGRAALRHTSGVVRFVAICFRIAWSAVKPGFVWTAQLIVKSFARLLRSLASFKGNYYFRSSDQNSTAQVSRGAEARSLRDIDPQLAKEVAARAFERSEVGQMLEELEAPGAGKAPSIVEGVFPRINDN